MNKIFTIKFLLMCLFLQTNIISQNITFVPLNTVLDDTLGAEIVFEIELTNTSAIPQTAFIVRTGNILPQDWTSSICLDFCYPANVDSVATDATFGSSPLQPGESREVSLHIFTQNNHGTAEVQLQAGTLRDPLNRITENFTAGSITTGLEEDPVKNLDYYLSLNYPNPFNPSTVINFGIPKEGNVTLIVYDLLGRKISTLVNSRLTAGDHSVFFNAGGLPSGVYIYELNATGFKKSHKMILEK